MSPTTFHARMAKFENNITAFTECGTTQRRRDSCVHERTIFLK